VTTAGFDIAALEIYLPLSRLLNLHVAATQELHAATAKFLGTTKPGPPYIIGVAGSVAVGKSTTSRLLRALLARWPDHPRVDLVTTDGFLLPNAVLQARGLMKRKGFPESYDLRRLVQFVSDIKSGVEEVRAPVYSHTRYDIVEGEYHVVTQPDILILEGLNVLQSGTPRRQGPPRAFVSDFFDFSIYVDADEQDIENWYVERFMTLRETVFRDPTSYFSHYAALTPGEARDVARLVERDHQLVVEEEAARIEVGRAGQREAVVDDDRLRMHHVRREPDARTGACQIAQRPVSRHVGEPVIRALRQHQIDRDAAARREGQCHQQGRVGNEVRRHREDALARHEGARDEQDDRPVVRDLVHRRSLAG